MNMQLTDINNADISELNWLYGRLVEQKKKEIAKMRGDKDG